MNATTLETTRRFLSRRLRIDKRAIVPESTVALEGPILADLLLDIEEAFAIRLSRDRNRISTLGDLLIVVAWELAQARTASTQAGGRRAKSGANR